MNNREIAEQLLSEEQNFTSGYRKKLDAIESALNDAKREGRIEALNALLLVHWDIIPRGSVTVELARLRADAEQEKSR